MKFLGLGDNVVDHYIKENIIYPGGNAFNFAVFANKLGYESAYLGVFGDDEAADLVQKTACELGVSTDYCVYESGENGRARVSLENGDRVFLPGNRGGVSRTKPLRLSKLQIDYCKGFDLIHSSCYSFCEDMLPILKNQGCRLSFDFSVEFSPEYLEQVCPNLYVALLSAGHLPEAEIEPLIQSIHGYGVHLIILTRGSNGSLISYCGNHYDQSPCFVEAVDTMAAGDSFSTAFLCTFMDNLRYTMDFPMNHRRHGISETSVYIDYLVQVCLHKASVFSAQNCLVNGSFGYGKTPLEIKD